MAGVKTYFVYSDADGQLLGEYTATGNPIREYMYLEGERVAMYDYTTVEPKDSTNQKAIVYLHNNQVGQVQYAFNSDEQMIYERVQTPFSETMGEINAYDMKIPVRFPGQYYDSESGFNQNHYRDYDPSRGAYIQPDPRGQLLDFSDPDRQMAAQLGIAIPPKKFGYINHNYAYVDQSPVMNTDPTGEFPWIKGGIIIYCLYCSLTPDDEDRFCPNDMLPDPPPPPPPDPDACNKGANNSFNLKYKDKQGCF